MSQTMKKPRLRPIRSPQALERRKRLRALWHEVEWPVIIAVGLFSLLLGMAGLMRYHQALGTNYTLIDSLYQSIELFGLESIEMAPLGVMPWEIQIARLLSPLVTAYAMIKTLMVIFHEQFDYLSIRRLSNHVMICGLGRTGFLLAREFRQKGYPVLVIERDVSNAHIEACRETGAFLLFADARDPLVLKKAGVQHARYLLSVCGDDGTNAEIALIAKDIVNARTGPQMRCMIHIYDRNLWMLLRERELAPERAGRFSLEFFNLFDSGARILLGKYPPMPESSQVGQEPTILLIGLGNLGESLIIHAAQQWYLQSQARSKQMHITVIDPDAEIKINALCRRYPLVKTACQFSAYSINTTSPEFLLGDFLFDDSTRCTITHAYICLDEISVALSAGLALLQQLRGQQVKIMVRMSEDAGLASLIRNIKSPGAGLADLYAFGLLDQTCKADLLEDGTHETLARVIHKTYLEDMRQAGSLYDPIHFPALLPWDELPEQYQESNLSQAEHIGAKLFAAGYGIAPWTKPAAECFAFPAEDVEVMARMEHERWCSERKTWGWQYGKPRDDIVKVHPALLGWEDPRLDEEQKEKDRATVRRIPSYLSLAGFQVYRFTPPEN